MAEEKTRAESRWGERLEDTCVCSHPLGDHYALGGWPACAECADCKALKAAKEDTDEPCA